MRKEYDFSDAVRNPYIKKLRRQVTMNVFDSTLAFFKEEASETGIPYQTLMNLYLTDCAEKKKKLRLSWR
ncbi:MAG: antitoxin [Lachnospiraceae bacterium]|nr:antitoxin [Lachnospiraceae bacterium]MBR0091571.1 antitoxin [Lachnospiraceae bacterium]